MDSRIKNIIVNKLNQIGYLTNVAYINGGINIVVSTTERPLGLEIIICLDCVIVIKYRSQPLSYNTNSWKLCDPDLMPNLINKVKYYSNLR